MDAIVRWRGMWSIRYLRQASDATIERRWAGSRASLKPSLYRGSPGSEEVACLETRRQLGHDGKRGYSSK